MEIIPFTKVLVNTPVIFCVKTAKGNLWFNKANARLKERKKIVEADKQIKGDN